jgi:DNA modification methylase
MEEIIKECYRVLQNHRVFVFNVSDVVDNDKMDKINAFGKRKIPLPAYFIMMFERCGFTYVDDIIWDKGEVQSSRHKNGNRPYPFYQYPCNCYEHILVFHKHRLEKDLKYPCNECGSLNVKSNSYTHKGLRSWECRNPGCTKSEANRGKRFSLKSITTQNQVVNEENIIPEEFYKGIDSWRRDIHKLSPVIKINNKKENKLGHTAPFPMDIPEMSIRYFSYKGDIVLDMFSGSFTVPIVAQKLERIGVGFELRKDLFKECITKNLDNYECSYEEIE